MTADARGLNSKKSITRFKKDKLKLSDVIDSTLPQLLNQKGAPLQVDGVLLNWSDQFPLDGLAGSPRNFPAPPEKLSGQ
jgi:hypothetical protein